MKIRAFFTRMWRRRANANVLQSQCLPDPLRPLVMGLANTQVEELTCDEVFALLDVFAEAISRGEDAAARMPLVRHHLDMCQDCREELAILLRSMEATAR